MIFEQPDEAAARAQLDRVIDGLRGSAPRVAELLTDAEPDLLSHFTFPELHRARIRSTNPLERLNKEIPVLDWSIPEGPRRRLVRWVTVPRPDSKEISGAPSFGWLSAA
jgi:transposase-like protein